MSKYIIEIAKEYEEYFKGILICGIADGKFAVEVIAREDLEELNSDYINEHFGDLQDTAYQRGLDAAWAAARKIVCDDGIDMNTLCTIFRRGGSDSVIRDYSAAEAIAKLKAYEEKQKADDEIKVGDEVDWSGDKFIVTRIFQPRNMKEQCDGIDDDGCVYSDVLMDDLKKTGRHFDIQSILEAMRNDDV